MHRTLRVARIALGLLLAAVAPPSVAAAQVLVSDANARLLEARGAATSEASRRITELLAVTQGAPEISASRSPAALAAAIEGNSPMIASARDELRRIHNNLLALHSISDGDSAEIFRSADESVSATAAVALRAEAVLESLLTIPSAVRSADQARFDAAYRNVTSGLALLQDIQAISLRRQAADMEVGSPQQAQFLAMACYADGQSALHLGMSGAIDRVTAGNTMSEAASCMTNQIVVGRAGQQRPAPSDVDMARLRAKLDPLEAELFTTMSDAALLLNAAEEALVRGDNPGIMAGRFNPEIIDITRRIHQTTTEQREALANQ